MTTFFLTLQFSYANNEKSRAGKRVRKIFNKKPLAASPAKPAETASG